MAKAVSKQENPEAAPAYSTSFSWRAWGAWSEPTQSMTPLASPSRRRSRSDCSRRGGVDFGVGVVRAQPGAVGLGAAADDGVGEGEVVGGDLGADRGAALFGAADELDGAAGAEMQGVVGAAGELGEQEVAGDHDLLGLAGGGGEAEAGGGEPLVHDGAGDELGVLGVVGDGAAEASGVFEGGAHGAGAGEGDAVVGEADGACVAEFAHLHELPALHADGDAGQGQHPDYGVAPGEFEDGLDDGAAVGDGLGVGHAADGGVAAGGGGEAAGADGLFVFEAGLAQMAVGIDKTGGDDLAGGVDDLGAVGHADAVSDRLNLARSDEQVGDFVAIGGGVDDATAADKDISTRHWR